MPNTVIHRPVDRRVKESLWFEPYRTNVTSAGGEDGVAARIFEIIGVKNKVVVDFGAGDGKRISNSYDLANNKKWSAVLIEPSKAYAALHELYRERPDVFTVEDIVGFSDENKLDAHLDRAPFTVPVDFDFLSIDIDGNDIHVWRDLQKYKPRVVCIEFNHAIPNDVYLLQEKNLNLNLGSSLLATVEAAQEMGYELVAVTAPNAFFVLKELYPQFNIADNSVDAMHYNAYKETKLCQGYDGTLVLAGMARHWWKGFAIEEDRLQVLPSNMRKWKFDGYLWPTKALK
ncbi:hypothetical protein [Asticcacaulis sp.]|uniref:hypothetical protein n=1 Tax=Asticcacaulis sp. TaxID=1872648 RepID=UPI003F7C0B4F